MNMRRILVTGGAGYIGSHMCVELLQSGRDVLVLDNLSNSSSRSVEAVQRITQKKLGFIEGDIRNSELLAKIFSHHDIEAVLHFAGLKAVGESVAQPAKYYDNNLNGTLNLIQAISHAECKTIVFSSSATVYGIPDEMPIHEDCPTGPISPYGRTKLMVEEVLRDTFAADPSWRISLLRYFNPVGAHSTGEIGEDPNDIPNNLMPFVSQVAVGKLDKLNVFGDDYPTQDGTGVRDYIHVVDLVRGHLSALEYLADGPKCEAHNLGTGKGYSVFDVVKAFEAASGKHIPYKVVDRRPGDAAVSFADPSRAKAELGWEAEFGIERMCADAWRWQRLYTQRYSSD